MSIQKKGFYFVSSNAACFILLMVCIFLVQCKTDYAFSVEESNEGLTINTDHYNLQILKEGFRFQFSHTTGNVIAPFHKSSGLMIGNDIDNLHQINSIKVISSEKEKIELEASTEDGLVSEVILNLEPRMIKLEVNPIVEGEYVIVARTDQQLCHFPRAGICIGQHGT